MNGSAARFFRVGVSLSGLMVLGWVLTGQAAKPEQQGLPTDWSHSHVIYSKPASTAQEREVAQDPRYWQQRYRREIPREFPVERFHAASEATGRAPSASPGGLWEENMGSAGTPGAGNYAAKYSFSLTTANCASASQPDYVVYSTGRLGAGAQASIVGYDNIYSGCSGTVPSIYWAYNTGGLILTSPVISQDGTQVAFVQTSGSPTGNAGLVLLKWKASTTETITSPGVPTSVTALLYPTCVAPCMTEVLLHTGTGGSLDDRTSSPYYDYTNDIAWVGGAGGWLHKITGAFKGTPAEVSSGGFPVKVNATGNALSNPVYDHTSQNVFVGDVGAGGGFLYRVASATGVATASAQLDHSVGLVEGPLLDVTGGLIFAFASSDGTTNCTGGVACSAVYELSRTFASGTSGTSVAVGSSSANPNPMYIGAFDSAYYNSSNATGELYVCGNTGSYPTIYRVPIAAGVMTTPVPGAALTPAARSPACSPVTDFPNPNASVSKAELLYFSVQNFGRGCANKGCLMNFVDLPWQPTTHYNFGQEILVLRTATDLAYISVALNSGTTGTTQPVWSNIVGVKLVDGGVTWLNQGLTTVTALAGWTLNHNYGLQARILDTNNNVEVTVQAGRSGGTQPTWNTTIGGQTTDNAAIWINAGPWPSSGLTVTGGTGGVIVDGMSTATGASQVYFFNLTNQACTTSGGTGICAMQASQANLN